MVEVEVTERVTTVAPEENVVYVDVSEQKVNIDVSLTIQAAAAGGLHSAYRVAASSFSGASGDRDRTYQFTAGLGTRHIIAAGTATGALTILDSAGYALSSTTVQYDTLTVYRELFDDEVVTVWL